jgi:catechol 2,3-dioxygenase-like lactoylglutathione lyase family enzyme
VAGDARGFVVNHVGQCVADLERSRRFYVELLGFNVDRELAVPDGAAGALLGIELPVGLTALYLRLGDFTLELMAFDREGNPGFRERHFNEPGLTHLSLSVDDPVGIAARVGDYGGEVVTDLQVAVIVRDPDGQLLELLPSTYDARIRADRAARDQVGLTA